MKKIEKEKFGKTIAMPHFIKFKDPANLTLSRDLSTLACSYLSQYK